MNDLELNVYRSYQGYTNHSVTFDIEYDGNR